MKRYKRASKNKRHQQKRRVNANQNSHALISILGNLETQFSLVLQYLQETRDRDLAAPCTNQTHWKPTPPSLRTLYSQLLLLLGVERPDHDLSVLINQILRKSAEFRTKQRALDPAHSARTFLHREHQRQIAEQLFSSLHVQTTGEEQSSPSSGGDLEQTATGEREQSTPEETDRNS